MSYSRQRNTGGIAALLLVAVAAAAIAAVVLCLLVYGLVRLTVWTVRQIDQHDRARHEQRLLEWRLRHAMRDVDLRIHKGEYPRSRSLPALKQGDRIDRYLEARRR